LQSEADISFSNPKLKFSQEEFEQIAELIKREL